MVRTGRLSELATIYTQGSFTRGLAVASGTQAVVGVGYEPKALIFFTSAINVPRASWGFSTGAGGEQNLAWYHLVVSNAFTFTPGSGSIDIGFGSGNRYLGNVLSMDSDGFTITWVRTGTPTGTATIMYMALR